MSLASVKYPLAMRPGDTKIIQLINPDRTPYVIATGATIRSIAINIFGEILADMTATITDSATGKFSVTLPDNTLVRSHQGFASWDTMLTLPTKREFLAQSRLSILYSGSLVASIAATPAPTPAPVPAPTPTPTPAPVPNNISIVGIDMRDVANAIDYYLTVDTEWD